MNRVETGGVEFEYIGGDGSSRVDWSGLFIRGDNAAYLAMNIRSLKIAIEEMPDSDHKKYAMFYLKSIEGQLEVIHKDVIVNHSS